MLELHPGVTLAEGRYRVDRLLGTGGMASVWLGWDVTLEREVAVKVISDAFALDAAYVARFEREAKIAASLSHPNLVQVYDYAAEGERPYLVTEYVRGGTLADRRDIDVETLARQLLDAVAYVHEAGIVHRDIKPANVLIGESDRRARLTDFGIARVEDATHLTQTGEVVGTRRYIAPEVLAGQPATPRSDLYSCGVLLRDHLHPDAPERLAHTVAALAAPTPDRRPPSAREALARLDERPLTAPTVRLPTSTDEQPPPTYRARREFSMDVPPRTALAGLAGVALLIAIIVAIAGGGGDESGRERDDRQAQTGAGEAPRETSPESASDQPDDPAEGARLNQEGYRLIQEGRHERAVPVLRRAVAAFPEGTDDLNYAYALFNLGQALRLSGRPEEAVPILEERLKIDNQRTTVRRELEAARRASR